MENNKFSVSMCVYGEDNAEWFKIAVDSIVNQTLVPNEVVIVVDGPVPEKLNSIIKGYEADPLFKIIRLEKNQGHGSARRTGLNNCSYELVALMDADDISVPDRFEKQICHFEHNPDLTIVGGQISEFFENPEQPASYRYVPERDNDIKEYMKSRCPMNQPSVMFKKKHIEDVGGYIDWYCNEDYYLWIRIALAGYKLANAPDVFVNMRTTPYSYQRRGGWMYFKSESKLHKYMLQNKIISFDKYLLNVTQRLILQVLMPNKLRSWIFIKFARS